MTGVQGRGYDHVDPGRALYGMLTSVEAGGHVLRPVVSGITPRMLDSRRIAPSNGWAAPISPPGMSAPAPTTWPRCAARPPTPPADIRRARTRLQGRVQPPAFFPMHATAPPKTAMNRPPVRETRPGPPRRQTMIAIPSDCPARQTIARQTAAGAAPPGSDLPVSSGSVISVAAIRSSSSSVRPAARR